MIDLGLPQRSRRKPSLTPMIDVVFLLLVFFMLASRFGTDNVIPFPLAGGGGAYTGAPRLVDVTPTEVRLNNTPMPLPDVISGLKDLMESTTDTVILRGRDDATLQHVISINGALATAGFNNIVLIE